MTAELTAILSRLIDKLDDRRSATQRRRTEVLKEEPSYSGSHELACLDAELDKLRQAQDILSDALGELAAIDNDGEQAA